MINLTRIEPDPPNEDDLAEYIYQEFLRIADALNENFNAIETKVLEMETRLDTLENP